MWELYAFWAFVPPVLVAHAARHADGGANVSILSFAVIAAGAVGCVAGGLVSLRHGSARVGFVQLAASGLCCLLSPLVFLAPGVAFIPFLLVWGIVVAGDPPSSPLSMRATRPVMPSGPGRYEPQMVTYTLRGHAWDRLDPAAPKFARMPPMSASAHTEALHVEVVKISGVGRQADLPATYSSKRLVASRSRSYRLASGNGGNQGSRRTVQSS